MANGEPFTGRGGPKETSRDQNTLTKAKGMDRLGSSRESSGKALRRVDVVDELSDTSIKA